MCLPPEEIAEVREGERQLLWAHATLSSGRTEGKGSFIRPPAVIHKLVEVYTTRRPLLTGCKGGVRDFLLQLNIQFVSCV